MMHQIGYRRKKTREGISRETKHCGIVSGNLPPEEGAGGPRVLLDFSLTVKAAPHECVIRTSQP